jgi:translation elongation factor EF-G
MTQRQCHEIEIPADMQDDVETERENLIENVAEADDALIERYLEGEDHHQPGASRHLEKRHSFAHIRTGAVRLCHRLKSASMC